MAEEQVVKKTRTRKKKVEAAEAATVAAETAEAVTETSTGEVAIETAKDTAEITTEAAVTVEATSVTEAAQKAAKEYKFPVVYCGPSVRGVAKQYTVYNKSLPKALEGFTEKYPAARSLIVPIAKFSAFRVKLNTLGTAEAIMYKKLRNQL